MESAYIFIVATSIWVYFDAKAIGVKKGQVPGLCNMGPAGWFFVTLFLWIVGFPAWLAYRGKYKQINSCDKIQKDDA